MTDYGLYSVISQLIITFSNNKLPIQLHGLYSSEGVAGLGIRQRAVQPSRHASATSKMIMYICSVFFGRGFNHPEASTCSITTAPLAYSYCQNSKGPNGPLFFSMVHS